MNTEATGGICRAICVPKKTEPVFFSRQKLFLCRKCRPKPRSCQRNFRLYRTRFPFTVALGEPKTIFSVTNDEGEIFQGFLELVGPQKTSSLDNTAPSLAEQPPVVVGTYPASGSRDIPAGETEIRVRFSKPMQVESMSWSMAWGKFQAGNRRLAALPQ